MNQKYQFRIYFQLGPIGLSPAFSKSLFERLMYEDSGVPVAHLCRQYRMSPVISKFPSDHFYNGKVKVSIELLSQLKKVGGTDKILILGWSQLLRQTTFCGCSSWSSTVCP
jgi:superfamily I DNA and/or RNA helicase